MSSTTATNTPDPCALKDESAQRLIDWHYSVEPGMKNIFRIVSENESDPAEPIKLLEVSENTLDTGRVETFTFAASGDISFPSRIAIVTPAELVKIRSGSIALPAGWDVKNWKSHAKRKANNARRKK